MKELEKTIKELLGEIANDTGSAINVNLTPESILLETGLDSLGFAILVARLEMTLGYDPFVIMETPCYPVTFGDFLEVYEKYAPEAN